MLQMKSVRTLVFVGIISAQGLMYCVGEAPVVAPIATEASCSSCPRNILTLNNAGRVALVAALAAVGVSFWAVYDKDKTVLENVQNYPNNIWVRLNNALAGLKKSQKCY